MDGEGEELEPGEPAVAPRTGDEAGSGSGHSAPETGTTADPGSADQEGDQVGAGSTAGEALAEAETAPDDGSAADELAGRRDTCTSRRETAESGVAAGEAELDSLEIDEEGVDAAGREAEVIGESVLDATVESAKNQADEPTGGDDDVDEPHAAGDTSDTEDRQGSLGEGPGSTNMSIEVVDAMYNAAQEGMPVSSPEAAEQLMKTLEEEAAREEEVDRETEAQILAEAGSASPSSDPPTVSADLSGQLLSNEVQAVELELAWLPAAGSPLERVPSQASEGADAHDQLAAEWVVESELVASALRWMPLARTPPAPRQHLPAPSSAERREHARESALGSGDVISAPSTPAGSHPTPSGAAPADAADVTDVTVRERQILTDLVFSSEEEAAARQLQEDVRALFGGDEGSGGGGVAVTAVELGGDVSSRDGAASAEALLRAQPSRTRLAFLAALARESAEGGAVVRWARARSALVVQLAIRCLAPSPPHPALHPGLAPLLPAPHLPLPYPHLITTACSCPRSLIATAASRTLSCATCS